MLFNQDAEGRFSAIAASFNPASCENVQFSKILFLGLI